jgi:heat shock protein HtpX
MFRRIGLFILTNLLVMLTITVVSYIIFSIFGIDPYQWRGPGGIQYTSLLIFCVLWGMGGAFISLLLSKVMAKWMMGLVMIDPSNPGQYGSLVSMVHRLASKAGLTVMPEVAVYESPDINAFATGPSRSNSLVAVSTGLLQRMEHEQVEGVVGHEIAHIANGDMVTMTLVQGVVNAFVMFFARVVAFALAQFFRKNDEEQSPFIQMMVVFVLEILFGILGSTVVAWFSRYREFRADAGGAKFAGRDKMIGALQKLKAFHESRDSENVQEVKGMASMQISSKPSKFLSLFSTHPPLEDRIQALRDLRQ